MRHRHAAGQPRRAAGDGDRRTARRSRARAASGAPSTPTRWHRPSLSSHAFATTAAAAASSRSTRRRRSTCSAAIGDDRRRRRLRRTRRSAAALHRRRRHLAARRSPAANGFCGGQCFYDIFVAMDPTTPPQHDLPRRRRQRRLHARLHARRPTAEPPSRRRRPRRRPPRRQPRDRRRALGPDRSSTRATTAASAGRRRRPRPGRASTTRASRDPVPEPRLHPTDRNF